MANNRIDSTTTNDSISDQVQRIVEAGQDKIGEVRDRIIGVKDNVVEKADSMVGKLVNAIKTRPLVSIGVAFGIGYVAMRLFRR